MLMNRYLKPDNRWQNTFGPTTKTGNIRPGLL